MQNSTTRHPANRELIWVDLEPNKQQLSFLHFYQVEEEGQAETTEVTTHDDET